MRKRELPPFRRRALSSFYSRMLVWALLCNARPRECWSLRLAGRISSSALATLFRERKSFHEDLTASSRSICSGFPVKCCKKAGWVLRTYPNDSDFVENVGSALVIWFQIIFEIFVLLRVVQDVFESFMMIVHQIPLGSESIWKLP